MTDQHPAGENYAASFLDISAMLDPLLDMVAGYRAKLELAGFSPTMAEAMSAQVHGQMLARMFAQ